MNKLILILILLSTSLSFAQTGGDGEGSTSVCLSLENVYPQSAHLRCVPEPRKPCDMPRPCGGNITHKYANMIGYHKAPKTKKLAYNCADWEYLPGCDPGGDVGNCPKRCNRWMPPTCHIECKKCLPDYKEFQSVQRGCLCPNRCCSPAPGEHPNFPGYYRIDDNELVRCNSEMTCAGLPQQCTINGEVVPCEGELPPPTTVDPGECPQAAPPPPRPDRLCTVEINAEVNCSGTPHP